MQTYRGSTVDILTIPAKPKQRLVAGPCRAPGEVQEGVLLERRSPSLFLLPKKHNKYDHEVHVFLLKDSYVSQFIINAYPQAAYLASNRRHGPVTHGATMSIQRRYTPIPKTNRRAKLLLHRLLQARKKSTRKQAQPCPRTIITSIKQPIQPAILWIRQSTTAQADRQAATAPSMDNVPITIKLRSSSIHPGLMESYPRKRYPEHHCANDRPRPRR